MPSPATAIYARINDGTNNAQDVTIAGPGDHTAFVAGMRRDVDTQDEVEAFLDGVGSGSPTTDNTTGTLANGTDVTVGHTTDTLAGSVWAVCPVS